MTPIAASAAMAPFAGQRTSRPRPSAVAGTVAWTTTIGAAAVDSPAVHRAATIDPQTGGGAFSSSGRASTMLVAVVVTDCPKTRGRDNGAELGLGPFASARSIHKHFEVDEIRICSEARYRLLWQHALDDQQDRLVGHRLSAIGEDGDGAIVVPIVQDRAQHIGVSARRDAVKETAADDLATRFHSARRQDRWRARHDIGEIEKDAARIPVRRKEVGE